MGIYYATERWLTLIESMSRPIERLIKHYAGSGVLLQAARQLITEQLEAFQDHALLLGIRDATVLDYFELHQGLRRWTPSGHATNAVTLYASPTFIRLAFDVTPRERLARLIHRKLTAIFIPAWADVEYFNPGPSAVARGEVDELALRGLRLWQGSSRDILFDTIAEGTAYRQYWDREGLLDLALRVARGQTENRHESVFQQVLWFEGFEKHRRQLSLQVRRAQRRASDGVRQKVGDRV